MKVMFEQVLEGGEGVSLWAPRRKSISGGGDGGMKSQRRDSAWGSGAAAGRPAGFQQGVLGMWGRRRSKRRKRLGREGLLLGENGKPRQCCRWRTDVIGPRFLKRYASQYVNRLKSKVQTQEAVEIFQAREAMVT